MGRDACCILQINVHPGGGKEILETGESKRETGPSMGEGGISLSDMSLGDPVRDPVSRKKPGDMREHAQRTLHRRTQ